MYEKLNAMLGELRTCEVDALRNLRTAEAELIASGSHDETLVQAARALHREVTEAMKELTDAVRAAQRFREVVR